jgi:UDP:flavonoid glycosyltransferase YjiC (YdhE family)
MRILALTFGTEGDSRPMIALCRGLRDAGHDVTLLAERTARSYAEALDVPFVALAGDMASELRAESNTLLAKGGDFQYVARALAAIARRNTSAWMRTAVEHARGTDTVIGAGLAIYVALSTAEYLRVPFVGAGLQPMMPTREFASSFLPPWPLPAWVNRASHRLVLAVLWRAFRGAVNDARRDVTQQAPRRAQWDGYPVLCGISRTLVPQPRDWPECFAIVGYWWPPREPDFTPDATLAKFLDAGEAPIYVGFGSMLGFDRDRMLSTVLDALDGRRALLSAGWSGFGARTSLPPNLHAIGHTPHAWLFPRMHAIVHHGGAGTTHAAARAGVPSVVLPFAADQFFWAERLRKLGIAPPGIRHAKLTARLLGERLAEASDPAMTARARHVAAEMAHENGVANALERIEHWVG